MEHAEEKTSIHQLEKCFNFLGYSFRRRPSLLTLRTSTILLHAKESQIRFCRKIKEMTSSSTAFVDPNYLIKKLNYNIKGWTQYFMFSWVSRLFTKLDCYLHLRFGDWLRKKFQPHAKGRKKRDPNVGTWKWLRSRYLHRDIYERLLWCVREGIVIMGKSFSPIKSPFHVRNVPTMYSMDFG
jgi:RNA-directed DNA polymerase